MSKFILFALICFYASTTSYAQGNCTKKEPLYIIYTDTDNFDIVNLKNDSIKVGYDLYLFNVKKSGAGYDYSLNQEGNLRSEERRVGKECRFCRSTYHYKYVFNNNC